MEKKLKIMLVLAWLACLLTFSSCANGSLNKVVIAAEQDLEFLPLTEQTYPYEKHILVKTDDGEMTIRKKSIVWSICYLKTAFPKNDIVINYEVIKDGDRVTLIPQSLAIN